MSKQLYDGKEYEKLTGWNRKMRYEFQNDVIKPVKEKSIGYVRSSDGKQIRGEKLYDEKAVERGCYARLLYEVGYKTSEIKELFSENKVDYMNVLENAKKRCHKEIEHLKKVELVIKALSSLNLSDVVIGIFSFENIDDAADRILRLLGNTNIDEVIEVIERLNRQDTKEGNEKLIMILREIERYALEYENLNEDKQNEYFSSSGFDKYMEKMESKCFAAFNVCKINRWIFWENIAHSSMFNETIDSLGKARLDKIVEFISSFYMCSFIEMYRNKYEIDIGIYEKIFAEASVIKKKEKEQLTAHIVDVINEFSPGVTYDDINRLIESLKRLTIWEKSDLQNDKNIWQIADMVKANYK